MDKRYNLGILEALFKDHLIADKKSKVTVKCYLSDIRHFLRWLQWQNSALFESSETAMDTFIFLAQPEVIKAYFVYLREAGTPEGTIKRRWFPLQDFFLFCVGRSILTVNPAYNLRSQLFPDHSTGSQKFVNEEKGHDIDFNSDYYKSLNAQLKNDIQEIYSEIITLS